ncbi:hypothetical protein B2I21_33110 [Chryseobacterium mucoviscidosis]|nr:hypothetical protein B2I21_33110 [Chryseobacterium mucoviscidosis]
MPEQPELKRLKWENGKEYCELFCPMTGRVEMTYSDGGPCYSSYTVPLVDKDGDVYCWRYDHDEDCWCEDDRVWMGDADHVDENTKYYL